LYLFCIALVTELQALDKDSAFVNHHFQVGIIGAYFGALRTRLHILFQKSIIGETTERVTLDLLNATCTDIQRIAIQNIHNIT
jgi:hypothetical protein